MILYALVGSSGTGKSYRAIEVAKDYNIEMIIDDGLLIWRTKVVAGTSAKKENTKIAAVKRALFMSPEHTEDAQRAINACNPATLLILGTSDGMVKRIQERLELPAIKKTIYIEEVSNKEDIERAKRVRRKEGKHVIPVPALEVKKHFSGYFLDTLRIFRRNPHSRKAEMQEKTVVRPTFSYLGRYTIADTVVTSIIHFIAEKWKGIYKVGRVYILTYDYGITIEVDMILTYGYVIPTLLEKVQGQIREEVEYMTGQNILGVNIYVKGLWVEEHENYRI